MFVTLRDNMRTVDRESGHIASATRWSDAARCPKRAEYRS